MATILIIPFAFFACGFFTIAFTIDKYVKEQNRETYM